MKAYRVHEYGDAAKFIEDEVNKLPSCFRSRGSEVQILSPPKNIQKKLIVN